MEKENIPKAENQPYLGSGLSSLQSFKHKPSLQLQTTAALQAADPQPSSASLPSLGY